MDSSEPFKFASQFGHSDYVEAVEAFCNDDQSNPKQTKKSVQPKSRATGKEESGEDFMKLEDGEYIEEE